MVSCELTGGSCLPQVKPDLSNFDESQAWPVLLDNFVDWSRERMARKAAIL